MQRLVLRLGSQVDDPIHWLVFNEQENEIIASGCLEDATQLSSLHERSTSAEVIAIAPSSSLYFTQVELPSKGAKKALAAIPFMVEEELADNIEDLFFAYGENINDRQEIAIVAREQLVLWQTLMSEAGIFCQQLIPDVKCLPQNEYIHCVVFDDQLICTMPDGSYIQGELSWSLPLVIEHAKASELKIKAYNEIEELAQTDFVEFDYERLPIEVLMKGAQNSTVNLLQGDFKVKRQGNPVYEKWKVAASLAAIALTVNLIYTSVELASIKQERAEVLAQTRQVVADAFPSIKNYRNRLRSTVQRQMTSLEQGGSGASMLTMLSRLGQVFDNTGVKPQSIRFDGARSELRMQSIADNFDAMEKFKREAQALGFEVDQGAINNRGDQVSGQIVVKG